MQTREIPRDEWTFYLDALSDKERTHRIRIEVDGEDIGEEILTEGLPLYGITLDEKGSEAGSIEVTLGQDEPVLAHRIDGVMHLWVEEQDGGAVEALDFEDTAQHKTVISFLH